MKGADEFTFWVFLIIWMIHWIWSWLLFARGEWGTGYLVISVGLAYFATAMVTLGREK